MDALNQHLDSLASLGAWHSQGEFTLAQGQVWERLRQALPDGNGSLRFLLRWLHARRASQIAIVENKPSSLTITAHFQHPATLPNLVQGEELDFSGLDIDLARAGVGAQMLESVALRLELDNGSIRHSRELDQDGCWQAESSQGKPCFVATYQMARPRWPLVGEWEKEIRQRFSCTFADLSWNGTALSAPYSFPVPVLAWRHLRRQSKDGPPLVVSAPRTAIANFRAVRHRDIDVVLGMLMGYPSGDRADFQLLRRGELFALPQAERELAGFGGVVRVDEHPLDLAGDLAVWNESLERLVTSFKDEAVDMALQLYRHEPPLDSRQAESVFVGMQSVLLHLLDHQRFTEGHLLAEWLRESMGQESRLLGEFRSGYTFDQICSLLAEPAGQHQTSLRWRKQAEARVREHGARRPEVAEEALLISARLEMRSRRDKRDQLSGDTQGRLVQLAVKFDRSGRGREAARIYRMLAASVPGDDPQHAEYLSRASTRGA